MAFEKLIGNNNIKDILDKIIEENNVLHSYLFYGNDGIGKRRFAEEFAKMIMCISNNKKTCENCKSCIEIRNNNNPDFDIIESEGSIKIEQIRNMQTKIYEKPIISNRKVYIIDNADTMTVEAQNCLLKTLEEPPEYITIILIATNENKILNTVKSRCAKIAFQPISNIELKEFLEKKYNSEISKEMIKTCNRKYKKSHYNKRKFR